ncbi:hypothetical protein Q7C36_019478 [Tachysurus vachellii]|uniref:Uncharacterized protein n=1 Tax=Tachysurus vachellii TaxID=175792 RepID=A0AA88LWI4_TACVA|nr:hypothetical protein Q7C36_019478 [Tachysurus vachellii]
MVLGLTVPTARGLQKTALINITVTGDGVNISNDTNLSDCTDPLKQQQEKKPQTELKTDAEEMEGGIVSISTVQ